MNNKLSIVVPIYNVGSYLEECLDSLLNQGISNFEVIMVDDGSSDNSTEIMFNYDHKYENFKAYRKENGGLGQARNFGTKLATGQLITFVDSDDIIPENSYKKMLETINETGSDFIIGNVIRFNSVKDFPSVLHRKIFKEHKLKTHITESPELINDTTAWNKIYRMDFWLGNQFKFPEGMLYEDIPVTIPAHFKAKKVDIIIDVVYKWRARDFGDNSITQQRTDISNLADRLKAIQLVADYFSVDQEAQLIKHELDYKNLSTDFLIYLNNLDHGDDEYIDTFINYVSNYLEKVDDDTFLKIPVIDRIKYELVKRKEKSKLIEFLKEQRNNSMQRKALKTENGFTFDYKHIDLLPANMRIASSEFKPVTKLEKLNWHEQSLHMYGYSYIKGLDMKKKSDVNISAYLVNDLDEKVVDISSALKQIKRQDISAQRGLDIGSKIPLKRLYNYDWCGYDLRVNFDEIKQSFSTGLFYILLQINVSGVLNEVRISNPAPGYQTKPKYRVMDSVIFYPKYNANWELRLEVAQTKGNISKVYRDKKMIYFEGKYYGEVTGKKFALIDWSKRRRIELPFTIDENNNFSVNVKLNKLHGLRHRGQWFAHVVSNKERENILLDHKLVNEVISCGANEIDLMHSGAGNLLLNVEKFNPKVSKVVFKNEIAKVNIIVATNFYSHYKENYVQKLVLSSGNEEQEFPIDKFTDNKNYRILEFSIPLYSNSISLYSESKRFEVILRTTTTEKKVIDNVIEFNIEATDSFKHQFKDYRYSFYRTKKNNLLKFRISPEWAWIEKGPRKQDVIKKMFYPLWRKLPLQKKTIVFEAYWGKKYDCNPRAIYEYVNENLPEYKTVWFLRDQHTNVPGNAEKVRINSLKYYYYLARAKYFFNNVNFPDFYQKRKGAVEVQTMHGTPLKTLGLDNPNEIPENKIESFIEKCARWDLLTVPSDYVAEIAKSAYRFNNKILNVGYARNDKLYEMNEKVDKKELKRKMGLPENKKVIVYLPTWRTKGKFSLPINMDKMQNELNNNYSFVVKLHHFSKKGFDLKPYSDFAFDLTSYQDIRDLYLVADVLITDYSSVMFDYAVLKKPMLFYTYDYDNYKNNLRGLYIDFAEESPGPLIMNTDDLIKEIKDIANFRSKYKEKISLFEEKYIQYDKGTAAQEIAATVLKKS